MSFLMEAAKAVAGLAVLMALWLAAQAYLRRRLGAGAGTDMLEAMVHGCGNCAHGGDGSGCAGFRSCGSERHDS